MTGRGEPGDIADLGGEDRGGDRADSVDGLDGVIAGVVTEHVTDAEVSSLISWSNVAMRTMIDSMR